MAALEEVIVEEEEDKVPKELKQQEEQEHVDKEEEAEEEEEEEEDDELEEEEEGGGGGETKMAVRGKREKKATTFFAPSKAADESSSSGPTAEGTGTELGDISYIKEAIDKKKADDETLKQLHIICYSGPGQNTKRKKNLRAFNGFKDDDVKTQKLERLLSNKKLTLSEIKHICDVLGLEKGGTKEGVSERLVSFLADPVEGKKAAIRGQGKKRKKSSKPKKRLGKKGVTSTTKKAKAAKATSKATAKTTKRPVSAYMNFVAMMRPMVKADNPAMGFGEIGAELGKMWSNLSEAEKNEYKSAEDTSANSAMDEDDDEEEEEEEEEDEEDGEDSEQDAEEKEDEEVMLAEVEEDGDED